MTISNENHLQIGEEKRWGEIKLRKKLSKAIQLNHIKEIIYINKIDLAVKNNLIFPPKRTIYPAISKASGLNA
ncbi:hypothetical protein CBM15_06875 [Solibacillus kalamii]|uniref:Uncharacterized protein n=1 Tax=Solibacillus kalamii TaxID=1748298 RepID=A0ABX3ZKH2_9BACL|nr:hypothetical protein CBM15_06875 [Solibacillus kalamii]